MIATGAHFVVQVTSLAVVVTFHALSMRSGLTVVHRVGIFNQKVSFIAFQANILTLATLAICLRALVAS